jgi:hypothetical protein
MRCHLCYPNQITITNSIKQLRKGIISLLFKRNNSIKKCVNVDHVVPIKKFEKERNNFGRAIITTQPIKSKRKFSTISISSFFGFTIPFKKDELQQNEFFEDLALLIIKNHLPS